MLQGAPAGVSGCIAEFSFDPQKLIVFGNPVRSCWSAGLDLAHIQRDSQVSDGGILGLPGAVGGHRPPAIAVAGFHGFDRFR